MNALVRFEGITRAPGPDLMVLFSDEGGVLPHLTYFTAGDWTGYTPEVLLQLAKAAHPSKTILSVAWAEQKLWQGKHTLLVTVPGNSGTPLKATKDTRSSVKKHRDRDWRRHLEANAADVADRFDIATGELKDWRNDPGLRALAKREQFKTAVAAPVESGTDVVAKCCGISHTRGSFDALELLGASDRTEGFTAIHEERRACGCCKAVLTVITKRLMGEGR